MLGLLFLAYYPYVSVQPVNGRRPVDWCRIECLYGRVQNNVKQGSFTFLRLHENPIFWKYPSK